MARSTRVSSILAVAVLLASSAASAIEVTTGTDDLILNINPQIQPRFEWDVDGPPGSAAPSGHANFDFFIRRARLLLRGSAYKQFTFALLLNAAAGRARELQRLTDRARRPHRVCPGKGREHRHRPPLHAAHPCCAIVGDRYVRPRNPCRHPAVQQRA